MNDTMRPTIGRQGWALEFLDPYCKEFVNLAKSFNGPVADLGCGYGFTSIKLLEAGATVIANDLSAEQLEDLRRSVSDTMSERLTIVPGNATTLEFPSGTLGGILAARWVHFLPDDKEIRTILRKFYDWLQPGGKLCITNHTLLHAVIPEAYAEYLEKKARGDEWPGRVSTDKIQEGLRYRLPETIYGFDVDSVTRELVLAGFIVDKCELYGTRSWITKLWLEDNTVGAIATKK